ncbi:MAG: fused MFS/spermidine synthase [Thermoguttaceae bacterium]|jgi:hypothetical protein|nr:fused MFS/spermidine synthase [Thermoguttaceae bacterium]
MQLFYALTLFASATLLFFVQPMFAKMALPLLGGTPAVWNTCMVFYQAVLLLGYLYAHFSTKWLGPRRQAAVHLAVLLLPWLVLPIGIAANQLPTGGENPVPWLLLLLTVSVGLPFFVVSASAPMLQAWFAATGHPSARDPYFLYAASNLGSMLALLGYPVLIEPHLTLAAQSRYWAIGYAVLSVLTFGCAVLLWRWRRADDAADRAGPIDRTPDAAGRMAAPTAAQRLRWLALSFAPSSLLLGVTTFIQTDLAAVPLFWVLPLALYLLTFVLVFARRPLVWHRGILWLQPFLVVATALIFHTNLTEWMWAVLLLHLAMFFVTALACHGELARSRPPARWLTEFYIWMSLGGVLGGIFNALVAPSLFPTVVEYPLVIVVACLLRPQPEPGAHPIRSRWLDLVIPIWLWFVLKELTQWLAPADLGWIRVSWESIAVLAATGAIAVAFRSPWVRWPMVGAVVLLASLLILECGWPIKALELIGQVGSKGWLDDTEVERYVLGLGGLVALACLYRPVRFGLSVGVVLLVGHLWFGQDTGGEGARERLLYRDRSFFGVLRVEEQLDSDREPRTRTLMHGSTTHGQQSRDPEERLEPWTYYHRAGPLGEIFEYLIDPERQRELAVIGLGTGTTAAYAEKGQTLTYFEIDSAVRHIAEDPFPFLPPEDPYLFTYVNDARRRGARIDIVLGDARLKLREQNDGRFDLLAVDAFSSDAIPMHLLTKEAFQLYFQKLRPEGILMVHISNRYLELSPVVGNIAADLGLVARRFNDCDERQRGEYTSEWVAVVRKPEHLGDLFAEDHWEEIAPDPLVGIWTDDFSNILSVLTWYRDSRQWLSQRLARSEPAGGGDE